MMAEGGYHSWRHLVEWVDSASAEVEGLPSADCARLSLLFLVRKYVACELLCFCVLRVLPLLRGECFPPLHSVDGSIINRNFYGNAVNFG